MEINGGAINVHQLHSNRRYDRLYNASSRVSVTFYASYDLMKYSSSLEPPVHAMDVVLNLNIRLIGGSPG